MKANKKINVLFITPDASFYGAQQSLLQTLKNINRTKFHPIAFFVLGGPLTQKIEGLGIKVYLFEPKKWVPAHYRSSIGRFGQVISWIFVTSQLINIIKKEKIDIVYVNSSVIILSAIAARIMKCKVVCHIREILFPGKKRKILSFLMRYLPHKIIGVTEQAKQLYPPNIVARKYHTVYNGIDLIEYRLNQNSAEISKLYRIDKDDPVIGLVSQIIEHKGIEYYLEAVKNLIPSFPNLRAFLVGGVPSGGNEKYAKYIFSLSKKWKLNHNLIFTGFRKDIRPFINRFDILILCSLREAFPRTILEAMAFEKPVVTTSVGGTCEQVIPEVTGMIVPPKDPGALAEQIKYLLENKELAQEMGRQGRRRVEEHFDIRIKVKEIEAILEKISLIELS